MIFPEITRILKVMDTTENFSTYDANEYCPSPLLLVRGSILRRDERTVNVGKKWQWCGCNHWANISIWKAMEE